MQDIKYLLTSSVWHTLELVFLHLHGSTLDCVAWFFMFCKRTSFKYVLHAFVVSSQIRTQHEKESTNRQHAFEQKEGNFFFYLAYATRSKQTYLAVETRFQALSATFCIGQCMLGFF